MIIEEGKRKTMSETGSERESRGRKKRESISKERKYLPERTDKRV